MGIDSQGMVVVSNLITVKYFSVSFDGTGTVDVCVATGDVIIKSVLPFVKVAPGGLTTSALVTNEGTPRTLLAATVLASLTLGTTLTLFSTPFVLPDTKKIQRTNVGTGTGAGIFIVAVEYYKGSGDLN